MPRPPKQDPEFLQAALIGLQRTLEEVEQHIADLRSRLGVHSESKATPGRAKRTLSAAARKRIALAQKKRWAAYKANGKEAAEPQPKRKLSAAGRARIVAATKKRWADIRKARQAEVKPAPRVKAAVAGPPAAPAAE